MTGTVTLALETSARPASIAIAVGGAAPILVELDDSRAHASDLMPNVAAALESHGFGAHDLRTIIVGTGPGSYTGLRVGAAIALGLHRGTGAELIGVPSLACIAHRGLQDGESGVVLRNAFGGQLYIAGYRRHDRGVEEILAPACVAAEIAAEQATSHGVWLADEPAIKALGPSAPPEVRDTQPDAAGLVELTRSGAPLETGPEAIRPLYLRPFDAKVRRR